MKRRAFLAVALAPWGARAHDATHAAPVPGYTRATAAYAAPEVALVDMAGAPYDLRADLDRAGAVMLNFVFTSCTAICPLMAATFAQIQRGLAPNDPLRLLSISIDPEHDTPERLRQYAARFGARPGWRFVTGSALASASVQRAFGVYRGDKMNHDPVTLLRAAPGQPWLRLEGFASAQDLLREYRALAGR